MDGSHPPFELLSDGSEPMASVLRELAQVAPSRLTVLVEGPTGSGKEVAARDLHRLSGRRGPLVCVNCAAFAQGTAESEFFGHVRGAFTGALRDREGAVAAAEGGTLFLDEVGELDPRLQALLLRVLQEREVRPVGCDRARKVDVRFVAATNRPLDAMASQGRFRMDLLFRVSGSRLCLPSLLERRHEFPYLVPRLVQRIATEARRSPPDLHPGLPEALAERPWPGNFRQLQAWLEESIWKGRLDRLPGPADFPGEDPTGPHRCWSEATRAFQRRLLLASLERHARNRAETARALGLSRTALYAIARRLGVEL